MWSSARLKKKSCCWKSKFQRRWNLCLSGLPAEEEEVRVRVIDMCQNVAPGYKEKLLEVIDLFHRLGRKYLPKTAMSSFSFLWNIFTTRSGRHPNTKNLKADFAPDDPEKLNQLWPAIKKPHRQMRNTEPLCITTWYTHWSDACIHTEGEAPFSLNNFNCKVISDYDISSIQ